MKIIVIGATGTIGAKVADALSAKKHEVIRASRNGDIKVNLDDPATIRALFERVTDRIAALRQWLVSKLARRQYGLA